MAKIYFCRYPSHEDWYSGATPEEAHKAYEEYAGEDTDPEDLEWAEGDTKIPTVIRTELKILLTESVVDPKTKKTTKCKPAR